jgi:hypothetical protein
VKALPRQLPAISATSTTTSKNTNTTAATTMSTSNLVFIAVISTRVTDKKGYEAALQGKAFERWRGKR